MSAFSSGSTSEWLSKQSAVSMVWSDFGLSCFDYPLDRKNRDTVCTLLTDLPFKIIAVWLVSRPINGGKNNSKFEHWAIKIQAPPALISIDFLESNKKGAFGLCQTTASDAELEDFLHYFVKHKNNNYKNKNNIGKIRKKWDIIASVTPSPLKNTSYLKYIDDYDLNKLKSYMIHKKQKNKNKNNNNDNKEINILKEININRKVCDISDFLQMWTQITEKDNKDKPYNPIKHNCQQFAADLFQFLVGHKKEYQQKVKDVKEKVQSPFDKKRYNDDEKQETK